MIHIKTQNIPVEVAAAPKGKVKAASSKEAFLEALQTFTTEEQENSVEVEEKLTDEDEEVFENIPWFLGNLSFASENQEISLKIDVELSETTDEITVEAELPAVDLGRTVLPEEFDADLFIDPLKDTEEKALAVDNDAMELPILNKDVEPTEEISGVHIDTKESTIPKAPLQVEAQINQPITKAVPIQSAEELVEAVIAEERVIVPNGQTKESSAPAETQSQKLELNETFEVPSENTDLIIDLTETKVAPEVEVDVDETTIEIKANATDKKETTSQPEVTSIGQFNQLKLAESQPQIESVKVVPQEQTVQEVETFMVEEVQTSSELEKVSTARIQLTPKHLGEMDIELTIRDKELTAKLVVEQIETKEWLEQKIAQLTTNLAAQDIQVDEIQIVVAQDQANLMDSSFEDNPFFKQQKQSFQQKKSFHKGQEEEQTPKKAVRSNRPGNGRLSMWV